MRPISPEMLARAKQLILERPSASYVQRHLGIGYNYAMEIMEHFEAEGMIIRDSFGHWKILPA